MSYMILPVPQRSSGLSTDRPQDPSPGWEYFETDTKRKIMWTGDEWIILSIIPDDAWINVSAFGTGWSNYSSDYGGARYRRYTNGRVEIQGLVKGATGFGSLVFVLPVGYRPNKRQVFGTVSDSAGASRLDVNSNGDVYFMQGGAGFVSLNVSFFGDQ